MQYDLCAKLLNEALFILRKQSVQKQSGNSLCVDMEQSQKYHVK